MDMTSSKETAKSLNTLRSRCRAVYTIYGLGLVGALVLLFLRELSAALLVFIVLMAMYLSFRAKSTSTAQNGASIACAR